MHNLCRRASALAAPPVRVRYAPSPTGALHLGGLRTALFNFLFARRHGGAFLLRIEDTDAARLVPGSADALVRALHACGLAPDEGPALPPLPERGDRGPYVQSQRLALYREHAGVLLERGHAYPCFCSAERLAALRKQQAVAGGSAMYDRACSHIPPHESAARVKAGEAHVVRLRVHSIGRGGSSGDASPSSLLLTDDVLGHVRFALKDVDDTVLLKSDGWPTYHLASVIDDHAMEISHVIRGQEWVSSTPKHLLLYAALQWQPPRFAHLPLLLNPDRSKLSKRSGDASVEDFLAAGHSPEALVHFVAHLGWTPPATPSRGTITPLEDLARLFDLGAIHKANAIVDRSRLDAISNAHVRRSFAAAAAASTEKGDVTAHIVERALPHIAAALRQLVERATQGGQGLCDGGVSPPITPSEAASAIYARVSVSHLYSILHAQHERVAAMRDFAPLVLPFLVSNGDEFLALLKSDHAQETLRRLLAAPTSTPTTPLLSAALRDIATQWAAMSSDAFALGNAALDAAKAAARLSAPSLPPGRVLLPLRWAVTGLDVGAPLGVTLRLLGRDVALLRLTLALQHHSTVLGGGV